MDMYELYDNWALCLIFMHWSLCVGIVCTKKDAWLHKTVYECETAMATGKHDECEMHTLACMIHDHAIGKR